MPTKKMISQYSFLVALLCLAGLAIANPSGSRTPSLHSSFEKYVEMMHTIDASPALTEAWIRHVSMNRDATPYFWGSSESLTMSCSGSYQSDVTPTSVHKLKVGDFTAVAAMGDSLTAGNGVLAWTILGCLTEYRGRSWSIGGDQSYGSGVTTFANIMREFNSNVKGYSTGSGDVRSYGANLNVAVAGAIAQDMPAQARDLISKIRADSSIDFDKDWKLVTLFIGGNNLCAFCEDLDAHSPSTYISNIKEALDILKAELPRTFVNLVEIFDISPVAGLGNGLICSMVHGAVCGCGHGSNADTDGLTAMSRAYQLEVRELVNSGRYDSKDDFTVVNQPFFRETIPPNKSNGEPDLSYFAPDCFHFSSKGQNGAGKALWNSMLTPVGYKDVEWGLDQPALCPMTEFIPTYKN